MAHARVVQPRRAAFSSPILGADPPVLWELSRKAKVEDEEIDIVDKEIDKVDKGIDRMEKDKEEGSQETWIQVVPVGNCDRAWFAQFTICLFLVRI